jgi:hypothetical protein
LSTFCSIWSSLVQQQQQRTNECYSRWRCDSVAKCRRGFALSYLSYYNSPAPILMLLIPARSLLCRLEVYMHLKSNNVMVAIHMPHTQLRLPRCKGSLIVSTEERGGTAAAVAAHKQKCVHYCKQYMPDILAYRRGQDTKPQLQSK